MIQIDMQMPKDCEHCPCNDESYRCGATGTLFDYDVTCNRRMDDCPLIEQDAPIQDTKTLSLLFDTGDDIVNMEYVDVEVPAYAYGWKPTAFKWKG